MKRLNLLITIFSIIAIYFGCSNTTDDSTTKHTLPEGDDIILATINGSNITKNDYEYAINSMFSDKQRETLDKETRRKVFESLVSSRGIAQRQEKTMQENEKRELEKHIRAYREQLLVKQYIHKHVKPEPVTKEMIQDFYNSNPDKFGGEITKYYEMITTSRLVSPYEKDNFMSLLKESEKNANWKEWCQFLKIKGYPFVYRSGKTDEILLHSQLQKTIENLNKDDVSGILFVNDRLYVLKVNKITQKNPRPLSEVEAEIRKSLTPVQVSKSVKIATDEIMKNAEVVYNKDFDRLL